MASLQSLFLLCLLPAVAFGYTCVYDDGLNVNGATTCNGNINCYNQDEYDVNGKVVKTLKGCDAPTCPTNGCYNTVKSEIGWSQFCCCTGDRCNSAMSKSLLALPIMFVSYFLLK